MVSSIRRCRVDCALVHFKVEARFSIGDLSARGKNLLGLGKAFCEPFHRTFRIDIAPDSLFLACIRYRYQL